MAKVRGAEIAVELIVEIQDLILFCRASWAPFRAWWPQLSSLASPRLRQAR